MGGVYFYNDSDKVLSWRNMSQAGYSGVVQPGERTHDDCHSPFNTSWQYRFSYPGDPAFTCWLDVAGGFTCSQTYAVSRLGVVLMTPEKRRQLRF